MNDRALSWLRGAVREDDIPVVVQRLAKIIEDSCLADYGRARLASVPRFEIQRRYKMCSAIMAALVRDCHWAPSKALDHVPRYLRIELDGGTWEPPKRASWIAGTVEEEVDSDHPLAKAH